MDLEKKIARREFLKRTGFGLAFCASGGMTFFGGPNNAYATLVPGQIPQRTHGQLSMQWADADLIRKAANLHPFDLQGRMDLATNAMTCCTDPDWEYISYSLILLNTRPIYMGHTVGDFVDDMGRHTDALWMIRSATNTRLNDDIVHKMAQNAMDVVDQGMAWDPPADPFSWWSGADRPPGRWTHLPEATRVILGMMSYYRGSGDPRALETARALVHGFFQIANKNDSYLWYPTYNYEQVGADILPIGVPLGHVSVPAEGADSMGGNFPAAIMGLMLLPAMRYYQETLDPVAADLVVRFTRLVIDLMPNFASNISQTHSSLATASGIYMAGHVLGIPEFMDWAENVYQKFWPVYAIPDFGWTPENMGRERTKGHLCCETCAVTDLLELSIQLALTRDEKYWDYAERVAMNQLLENQILRTDFIQRVPDAFITALPGPQGVDPTWTADFVLPRCLGGFAIYGGPNDWFQTAGLMSLQCCFGSGSRGLYDAWYFAAMENEETVWVNMQFSKRLPSALIISMMPGLAVLEIEMTGAKRLLVRKPGWADQGQTRILVDGQERMPQMAGTYFDLGRLTVGAHVRVEFPNELVSKTEQLGAVTLTTQWRGNAVVKMDPAGEIYPLYQNRERTDGCVPLSFVNQDPICPLGILSNIRNNAAQSGWKLYE